MIRAEPVPSGAKLPHTVFPIPADAVRRRPDRWDDEAAESFTLADSRAGWRSAVMILKTL